MARRARCGPPACRGQQQVFVELAIGFVDDQVKGIFHGNRSVVTPVAITVFVWVLFLERHGLPARGHHGAGSTSTLFQQHNWRQVPTADVNTTFALALSVWVLMIFYSVKVKGLGGWIHELFCAPFGSNPLLWPPTSCSTWSSTSRSRCRTRCGSMETCTRVRSTSAAVAVGRDRSRRYHFRHVARRRLGNIADILIVVLQAFIFMMLTVVYLLDGARKRMKNELPNNSLTVTAERKSRWKKCNFSAMIQAYTSIGIGLMIGLGAAGACIGIGIDVQEAS